MADSLLWLSVVGYLIASSILLYAGYWAFSIRHALFVRAYRSQALWLGFFSLYVIPHAINLDAIITVLNSPIAYFANELYYIFLAVLLFRLIDVDVGLARRSDPLLREALHWKRLRLVVWSIMAFAITSLILLSVAGILGYSTPTPIVIPLQASVYLSFLISGSLALFVAARRSRDDVFRRSLKWFGFFFLGLLASTTVYFVTSSGLFSVSPDFLGVTLGYFSAPAAYGLYRSARSLVPIGRLSTSE
jgi:hypothetical protein